MGGYHGPPPGIRGASESRRKVGVGIGCSTDLRSSRGAHRPVVQQPARPAAARHRSTPWATPRARPASQRRPTRSGRDQFVIGRLLGRSASCPNGWYEMLASSAKKLIALRSGRSVSLCTVAASRPASQLASYGAGSSAAVDPDRRGDRNTSPPLAYRQSRHRGSSRTRFGQSDSSEQAPRAVSTGPGGGEAGNGRLGVRTRQQHQDGQCCGRRRGTMPRPATTAPSRLARSPRYSSAHRPEHVPLYRRPFA